MSPDIRILGTTCLRSTVLNSNILLGFISSSNISRILAKASSFGAKTVKFPLPPSVPTKSAALTALTREDKFWFAIAASTIFGFLTSENYDLNDSEIILIISIEIIDILSIFFNIYGPRLTLILAC